MLRSFVESNSVPAELINRKLSVNLARCVLLVPVEEAGMRVICIFMADRELSLERVERETGFKFRIAGEREVFNVTGYKEDFLPPVSVYGVKVLVDNTVLDKHFVNFIVGESLTLRIEPAAILEFNDDAVACRIIE